MTALIREARLLAEPLVLALRKKKSVDENSVLATSRKEAAAPWMPSGKENLHTPGRIPHSSGAELLDLPTAGNAAVTLTAAAALKEHEETLRKEVEPTRPQAREQG